MAAVHRIAAQGFGSQAEAYDRARPGYPPEVVAWCADELGIRPGRRVLDLAAGTGKLTALLAPLGADLVAAEPVAGMRDRLRAMLPGVPAVAAVAEALPFADASVDAVTVAQAFHWFDGPAAMADLARVVRPGGRMAAIWNARDRSEDWVDRVWRVMDRVEKHAPWRDHQDGTAGPDGATRWTERSLVTGEAWTPFTETTFGHRQQLGPDDVVERVRSVSHVAVLPGPEQEAVLDEIRSLLAEHPDTRGRDRLAIPYRVDCLLTERRG
jgi:SAM-dependent methyltransferase